MEDPEEPVKHRMAPRATIVPPSYSIDSEKAEDPKAADIEMNSISEGKEVEERDFRQKQVNLFMRMDYLQSFTDILLPYRCSRGGNWHGK